MQLGRIQESYCHLHSRDLGLVSSSDCFGLADEQFASDLATVHTWKTLSLNSYYPP